MLREYQEYALNGIFDYFYNYTGNPVIAMPTGTGKSHVIAELIKRALMYWPNQRFMMLTHVQELIEQNTAKLLEHWPQAPLGIFSAGLGHKQTYMPITYGGVASVVKAVEAFGHIDLLIIDECHLLSPNADTMYQTVIKVLKETNPYLKVVGLSATPYRLGQGMITDGGVFTDVAIDLTTRESFNWFIDQGYMANLLPRSTSIEVDVSEVNMNNGEFTLSGLEHQENKIMRQALEESLYYGAQRRSWLCFASGVDGSERAAAMLNHMGVRAAAIHRGIGKDDRRKRIAAYKAGEIRCLVNNNILTTGFDHPALDFIIVLRATMSPGLWVQMLGRGTRPNFAPGLPYQTREQRRYAMQVGGKTDCLVMDYAGNTPRLGPINDPVIPKKKGPGTGEVPVKICTTERLVSPQEGCGGYNHASVRYCDHCGGEFDFEVKIKTTAGTDALISDSQPIFEWFDVHTVVYRKHTKVGSPPMLKVTYQSMYQHFSEMVFLEHKGFPAKKSRDWWRARHWGEPPETIDDALAIAQSGELKTPHKIRVWMNKTYPEIINYEYD